MRPKILVARLSAIGDVVRTVPAVQALRTVFPDSEIHWLVEDRCAGIIENLPAIDHLIRIPRKEWRHMPPWQRIPAFTTFIRQLRQQRYDIFIDFHGILKSGLYGLLAAIPRRIGYPAGIAKEGNSLFSNEKVAAPKGRISRYTRNFLIPQYFNGTLTEQRTGLPLSKEDRQFASSFLDQHGLGDSPFAFFYPGTSNKGRYKRWPPERYGHLTDLLAEQCAMQTVVGWGPGEEELVGELCGHAKQPPVVLPLTSLKELCAVIERARIFVGGDTGAMHMASLAGTPVVTIFGPSDPLVNEPARFTPFRIVTADTDCAPCRNRACADLQCLTRINPEQVLQAVSELLQQTA